jgi:hypothetical protein
MALEWGSAVLSESIVFGVAAGFVVVEYRDKDIKEAEKKKMLQEWRDQVSETTRVLDEKVHTLLDKLEPLPKYAAPFVDLCRALHASTTGPPRLCTTPCSLHPPCTGFRSRSCQHCTMRPKRYYEKKSRIFERRSNIDGDWGVSHLSGLLLAEYTLVWWSVL